ncbi:MAG: DMT family transporter, partial [bacterium]
MSSIFALLSALLFAGNAVCVRLSLRGSTSATAVMVSVVTNLGALWLLAAVGGSLSHLATGATLVFLAAGLFAPALARLTYYESINLIGVAKAATISNTTPLFSAVLAVPILGEQLTWAVAAGTVLVVVGVALTFRPEPGAAVEPPGSAERRTRTLGLLLALNTAVMASISFMLRKFGLRLLPDPNLAAALTVTGSLVTLVPYLSIRRGRYPLRADRNSFIYLIAGGVLSTGGFLAYYLALNLGDVVRVTPLSNTSPLFAVLLLLVFHEVERLTRSTI